jgi:transcription elongation GreA/GreB family factor
MMKKKAGDSFELKKPNGEKVFYKIISIK